MTAQPRKPSEESGLVSMSSSLAAAARTQSGAFDAEELSKNGVSGDVWSVASHNPRLSSNKGFPGWGKGTLLCLEIHCRLIHAASGGKGKTIEAPNPF